MAACEYGHVKVGMMLINNGAVVNYQSKVVDCTLYICIRCTLINTILLIAHSCSFRMAGHHSTVQVRRVRQMWWNYSLSMVLNWTSKTRYLSWACVVLSYIQITIQSCTKVDCGWSVFVNKQLSFIAVHVIIGISPPGGLDSFGCGKLEGTHWYCQDLATSRGQPWRSGPGNRVCDF